MKTLHLKVGTMPMDQYQVRVRKPVQTYQRIAFRELKDGAKWEFGVITGFSGTLPLIERM